MGSDKQERARRNGTSGKRSSGIPYNPLFTYHPSRDEREAINKLNMSGEEALLLVEERLQSGLTLTLGYHVDKDACYAIIRVKQEKWDEAPALSAWHASFGKCLAILAYYLTTVNPEWPDVLPSASTREFNW